MIYHRPYRGEDATLTNASLHTKKIKRQKIVGSIFIGSIGGIGLGMSWEYINFVWFSIEPDENDVFRTWAGGVLGVGCAVFFKDIHFITFWMFYIVIALVVADLVRATLKKYKK